MKYGINQCTFAGNLGLKPQKGKRGEHDHATLMLIINEFVKDDDDRSEALFFDVWGKTALFADQYLQKGDQVIIQAKAIKREYDGADGKKKYALGFMVQNVISCGKNETKNK